MSCRERRMSCRECVAEHVCYTGDPATYRSWFLIKSLRGKGKCVLRRGLGIPTGLASSVSLSRQATLGGLRGDSYNDGMHMGVHM